MWQRALVLEYASKITAIDPTAARLAFDEVLGLVLRLRSEPPTAIFVARDVDHWDIAPEVEPV